MTIPDSRIRDAEIRQAQAEYELAKQRAYHAQYAGSYYEVRETRERLFRARRKLDALLSQGA